MHYLHTMIRVTDPDATIRFFDVLGLKEVRRMENEKGRFTLIFLAADEDMNACFPKDTQAFIHYAKQTESPLTILEEVVEYNTKIRKNR